MESYGHHDDAEDLFAQIKNIETSVEGLIEYHNAIDTIQAVTGDLLAEQNDTALITYAEGNEKNRRFISRYYFEEEEEQDCLPLVFGENTTFYQLLVYQDDYPFAEANNQHTIVCLNASIASNYKDLMYSSQVVHLFANGSSQVFSAGVRLGDLEKIQSGSFGPYVEQNEDGFEVVNKNRKYKLNPDNFSAQHWTLDQVDNLDHSKMVYSQKLYSDLSPLLDYFEVFHRNYLPKK